MATQPPQNPSVPGFQPAAPVVGQQPVPAQPGIAESPLLQQPKFSSSKQTNQSKKSKGPRINFALIAVSIFLLTLTAGGIGAGLYLSNQQQDTRQQASTPTGTARAVLNPTSTTLEANTIQTVDLTIELTSTPQIVQEIVLLANLIGDVPSDLQFVPSEVSGMSPPTVNLSTTAEGTTELSVTYISDNISGTNINSSSLNLGMLTFTTPEAGEITITFDASRSQLLVSPSGEDILRPPTETTYTIIPGLLAPNEEDETTQENGGEEQAEGGEEESENGDENLLADAGGAGGTTITPTPTQSPTRTPTPTPNLEDATDESRTSSLPVETQEKPTSGSTELTLGLLLFGFLFLSLGLAKWKA